jgi:type I restriction enzyme R subunit
MLLRLKNILSSFDEFKEQQIISDRDFQDYQSNYIDIYMNLKGHDKAEKTDINDDIVFELELVKQEEINIDYILNLVRQFHDSNSEDKEILSGIEKAIKSSIELRSKKELIECFIESVNANPNKGETLDGKWSAFTKAKKEEEVDELIEEERLNKAETIKFVNNSLRDGFLKTTGTDIDKLLPPMSRFGKDSNNRLKKKKTVIEKLKEIFDKFKGLNCFE